MEFLVQLLLQAMIVLGLVHLCWKRKKNHDKRKAPPQPTGAWPLIGHIRLLLGGNKVVHKILSDRADTYGSVFSLCMGLRETVVVSNWQVAKECFTTNDKTFSTRPRSLAFKMMAYDQTVIATAPYGPNWRGMRKFVVHNLLNNHKLQMLRHVLLSEIGFMMKSLYQQWDENGGKTPILVDFKERFEDMTTNIITRVVAGKRYDISNIKESKQSQKTQREFQHLSGQFLISDIFPFLGTWMDKLYGNCVEMKRIAKEADDVFSRWLKEHKEKRINGPIKEEENDLIHLMLSCMHDGGLVSSIADYDIETIIKTTCFSMILGGNDTTSITMTWALCFILNKRHVLRKAQEELDTHVGKHRQVEESDMMNLVYLQAIFKESLRLQPTLPLLIKREAMEDCIVAGFEIPNGTRLLVNVWKMHRDPSV